MPIVPFEEFRRALESDYLLAEEWLIDTNARHRAIFSLDDARRYLQEEREHMDSQVWQMDERAEAWARLATFAVLHDLQDEARILIRRAAGCLIAHHWHKETSLFTLLDALRMLYEALHDEEELPGAAEAELRDCVLQVAGPIAQVHEFTDGDVFPTLVN
jgi:hypothetical protein